MHTVLTGRGEADFPKTLGVALEIPPAAQTHLLELAPSRVLQEIHTQQQHWFQVTSITQPTVL